MPHLSGANELSLLMIYFSIIMIMAMDTITAASLAQFVSGQLLNIVHSNEWYPFSPQELNP